MSCLQCGKSMYGESGALCEKCRKRNHEECCQRTEEALYSKEQQHLMGNEDVDDQ